MSTAITTEVETTACPACLAERPTFVGDGCGHPAVLWSLARVNVGENVVTVYAWLNRDGQVETVVEIDTDSDVDPDAELVRVRVNDGEVYR